MMWAKFLRNSKILFAALLLLFSSMETCAETWFSDYKDGKAAVREGKYKAAVVLLSRAITQRPESKANVRTYGVQFIDYFPYLYRGLAYARLGNKANALNDFEKEHGAGEVYKGSQDTEAGEMLRKRLEEFRGTALVREPATRAVQEKVQDNGPDSLFKTAVHEFDQGNITRAKALFEQVRKRRPTYTGLDGQIARIRAFEQDVKTGIAAYLNGKYKQAVEILTPVVARGRGHVNAQAFLGCSHAALYLLSGGEAHNERDRALEIFRSVKQLDPEFDLKRTYVSPGIQELSSAVGAQ
jgi:tetratricopeptide (TPR) repeat protein